MISIHVDSPTVRFLISQLVAFIFGLYMHTYVRASHENSKRRHVMSIVVGFIIGIYCFRVDFCHLIIITAVSYAFLLETQHVHIITFVFTIGYLNILQMSRHVHIMFDIIVPMTIFIQKVTYISSDYKQNMPSLLEYFSYLFNYHGICIGPVCKFSDYIEYINGENYRKYITENTIDHKPNRMTSIIRKFILSMLFACIYACLHVNFKLENNVASHILSQSLVYRLFYLHTSSFTQRSCLYLMWTISDMVNNACGFGFNGYDSVGIPKWDLLSNIRPLQIELSTDFENTINHWHIQTRNWIRHVTSDTIANLEITLVFIFNLYAFLFYPACYYILLLCAFVIYANRIVRYTIRPLFIQNYSMSILYSFVCWCFTQFTTDYIIVSFFYLDIAKSIQFYNAWYWAVHAYVFMCYIAIP
jgi:lysophospholipid acyltransferase 1/2